MELADYIELYHNNLVRDLTESRAAKEYLRSRGITKETAIAHNIGYCKRNDPIPPPKVQKFNDEGKPINENWLLKGKVIVPIYSEFNEPVGLSCRGINPDDTWWNTNFDKNNHIFLLNKARRAMFESGKCYIGEGQIDGLIAHQFGIKNFVSLMSTTVTVRRLAYMARYCSAFCLVLDTDKNNVGQNACKKAVYQMSQIGITQIYEISLPEGKDPDEFLLQNGVEQFMALERKLSETEIADMSRFYLENLKIRKNVNKSTSGSD